MPTISGHYLSVRHPHAWWIVQGIKDVENRSWSTNLRGRVYIHASRKIEWDVWEEKVELGKIRCPTKEEMQATAGGLVGYVDIVDCKPATEIDSEWANPEPGMYGFVLDNAHTMPFVPLKANVRLRPFTIQVDWEEE